MKGFPMPRKQVLTVAVLALVFTWSVVMTAMGQVAAITTLIPSLVLGVQQILAVSIRAQPGRPAAVPSTTDRDEEHAG